MRSIEVDSWLILLAGIGLWFLLIVVWSKFSATGRVSFNTLVSPSITTRFGYWVVVVVITSPFLAVPLWLAGAQRIHDTGQEREHEIVILMDISYSMSAQDVGSTRSSLAHAIVNRFLREHDEYPYVSVGVVYFAGSPLIVHPISNSLEIAQEYVVGALPQSVDQARSVRTGTAMGEALIVADAMFSEFADHKEILLVSDGGVNTGTSPDQVASTLVGRGVTIHTMGVGTSVGGLVTVPTAFGSVQQNAGGVDRASLKGIAKRGGGQFFGVGSSQQGDQIQRALTNALVDQTRYRSQTIQPVWSMYAALSLLGALLCSLLLRSIGISPKSSSSKTYRLFHIGTLIIAVCILLAGRASLEESITTISLHGMHTTIVPVLVERHRVNPSVHIRVHDTLSDSCVGPMRYSKVEGVVINGLSRLGYSCQAVEHGRAVSLYQGYSPTRIVRALDGYMSRFRYTYWIVFAMRLFTLYHVRYE